MKPLLSYFKDLFASKKVTADVASLHGLEKADAMLLALVNEGKIPGIAVSILHQGKPLLQKGYGYADLEQKTLINPEKTLFRIASVSKPIAAVALAKMVAEGTIDLDASLYDYVPYYPKKKYDFTLRQLASHTAGIRGYKGKEYALNKPFSIKEGISVFKDDDLLFEPGTAYLYNSYDWALVSLAMQEASGVPFEAYVQEKVLMPLGLHLTQPEYPEVPIATCACFYSKRSLGFKKATPVHNIYKLAGGGYLSTASDVAKFGQALLNVSLGDETILKEFLTATEVNGASTYYGLGWQVSEDKKGRPFYGHVGNGVGGYANFFVYPAEEMVFSMVVNCTNPNIQEALDAVVDACLERIADAVV